MSTPLPPLPRSPFWGACVFATDRGFEISGVGCMAQGAGALDRALDLRSQTIQEDDEAFWFCRPASVGRERAKIIGRVAFAKDFAQRDGLSGAAAVVTEERIAEAGYGGLLATVTALHEQFLQLCLDGKSRQVTFGHERDLLGRLPLIDTTEPLMIGEERPLRVRLPPAWGAYAERSDIFLLIARHPDLMEAERRGFLLREKASAAYDVVLDSRLLERWLETVLRPHQDRERQLAEAYEREKILQAELSTVRSRAQDLAHERDEAHEESKKIAARLQQALLGEMAWAADLEKHFAEARAGIATELSDLDSLVQPVEAERRVWSTRARSRATALSHPPNLYLDPADGIPRQTVGQPERRVGWRPGVRLVVGVGVLLFLLLIWLQLRRVVAP